MEYTQWSTLGEVHSVGYTRWNTLGGVLHSVEYYTRWSTTLGGVHYTRWSFKIIINTLSSPCPPLSVSTLSNLNISRSQYVPLLKFFPFNILILNLLPFQVHK